MNILLWYLPYAMFSGACDVVLPASEMPTDAERPAATTDVPTPESLIVANRRAANFH
jgi:hypothetical protein